MIVSRYGQTKERRFSKRVSADRWITHSPLRFEISHRLLARRQSRNRHMNNFYKGNYKKEAAIGRKKPRRKRKDKFWIVGHFMPTKDARKTQDLAIKYWTFNKKRGHEEKLELRSTEVTLILEGTVRGFIEEEVDGSFVRTPIELRKGEYVVIPYGVRNNLIEKVVTKRAVGITIKAPNDPKFEPYKFSPKEERLGFSRRRKSKRATAF